MTQPPTRVRASRAHVAGRLLGGWRSPALLTRPEVMFADEPTGAPYTGTAREVLSLLRHAVDTLAATVVMVTHDPVAASYADQVVLLAEDALAGELPRPDPGTVADRMVTLTDPGGRAPSATAGPLGGTPRTPAPGGGPRGAAA